MSVSIRIPAQLRTLTAGAGEVAVEGQTVGEALGALDVAYPGFSDASSTTTAASGAS